MTDPFGLPELRYLNWAIERYGSVRYDLASSGLAALPIDALGPASETFAGATDPGSVARLRDVIAERFGVSPEQAVPVLGATHGLWCIYAALLGGHGNGAEVLVEAPVYEPLVRIAEGMRAKVIPFVRDLERGGAIDVDAIARLRTPRTRLVVVSNLHNPTGAFLDDATILALAKAVAPATLLVDEVYRDLIDPDAREGRTSFHLASNIVTTSSLTKVYGLPWVRAGWVLARAPIAAKVRTAQLHSTGMVSWALASAACHAFARIEELHARSRLAREHDGEAIARLSAWIAARPHLSFRAEPGSIFGFVVDRRGHDLQAVIERAIAEEGVIVAPGAFFGWPSGFRIRYGAFPLELLDEGLARLGRVLDRE